MANVSLKEVIFDYADEAELNTATYRRLRRIAVRGVKKLQLFATGKPKSCRLCVDANKTVQLPEDYLMWSKVGVLNGNGEVATLKYNSSLTSYAANDPNRLNKNTDGLRFDADYGWYPYLNYWGDGYFGCNLYGISGNEATKIGDFKIDDECDLIILDNCFPYDYIILEYLSTPSYDEDYKIPEQAREAMIAWLAWRDIAQKAASRKVSVYDKTQRKREFYNELNNLRYLLKPFRIQDAIDVSQDAIRLVVKS